ncbi:hypothetical protein CDAR_443831 [Caerostris darwini]|uniref:Uncharacterized protein n=1 Tax=Caerostris darwini TaxID=1538125 RepID=A0AAV4XAZ7_9ARAC|nr:hypothetical protein CDAR_443831 [Caerostris darwini]
MDKAPATGSSGSGVGFPEPVGISNNNSIIELDAKQESRKKPASVSKICRNAPRNFIRIWKRKAGVVRIHLWESELETEEFVWP